MSKTYISHLGMSYIPKNKAEKTAQGFASNMSRKVVPENQVNKFIEQFKEGINKINLEFTRCKDLELYIDSKDSLAPGDFRNGDIVIQLYGVFSLHLYWGE